MLGHHHLFLSVLTLSLVLVPFFGSSTTLVLVAVIGCAVGSLVPDADASDGAIFHQEVRGVRGDVRPIVNTVALIFPVFGYLTRYGIYKPIAFLFGIEERHRGFLHTMRGILVAAGLTALYVVTILLILARDLASLALGLLVFMSAYIIGAVLHLVEDTMTVSGVKPLKRLIRGRLRTRPDETRYQDAFILILVVLNVLAIFWVWWLALALLFVGWGTFLIGAKVHVGQ